MTRAKFGNKRIDVNGEKFDSIAESCRYAELLLLQKSGEISELRRQVIYELAPAVVINGKRKRALRYIADFVYMENGKMIVEDKKGFLTVVYKIKRHLMKSIHNIDILET